MNIILVHGSWHGGWCWEKLIPLLTQAGHTVYAPDLPGHGQDQTPREQITLKSYVNCVLQYLTACNGPVLLVGHSMAGIVISQVAEYMPEKISKLVYLTGCLPQNGDSVLSIAKLQKPGKTTALIRFVPEENAIYLSADAMQAFAYQQCDANQFTALKPLFCVEPFTPWIEAVQISSGHFGLVPRVYIECEFDNAIYLSSQQRMLAHTPCQKYRLATDHAPFYSDPLGLADILLALI